MTLAPSPPMPASLAEGDVHVWRIDLDAGAADHRLWAALSPDEVARAARFHFERDRARFVVARAALRRILEDYLGTGPAAIAFVYGSHGKPALARPWSESGVCFNLSHSQEVGLCAVTRDRRIGVDVERIRPLDDMQYLAGRVFSASERAALHRLPPSARLAGFFNAWTRKEAFIKALGEGLSHPLERFDVTLAPDVPARIERIDGDPRRAARWALCAVEVDDEHVGAVAVEAPPVALRLRRWPEDLGAG